MTDKAKRDARAAACKGFRWMPGMLDIAGKRAHLTDEGLRWASDVVEDDAYGEHVAVNDRHALPDTDDPATLGCIEHGLLPEAWGPGAQVDRESWVTRDGVRVYQVCVHGGDTCRDFTSTVGFGDALVAALEAAP